MADVDTHPAKASAPGVHGPGWAGAGATAGSLNDADAAPKPSKQKSPVPKLALGAGGRSRFSLALLVAQPPDPLDPEIAPHVRSALLSMDVSAGPRQMGRETALRELELLLIDGSDAVLARTRLSGFATVGALTCALERDEAIAVLAALQGKESNLWVECRYPAVGSSVDLTGEKRRISLTAILEAAFDGRDFEPLVAIVAPGIPGSTAYRQVQRLASPPRSRGGRGPDDAANLALRGSRIVAVEDDLRAARTRKSHLLMSSDLIATTVSPVSNIKLAWLQDLVLVAPDEQLRNLPVVRDTAAALWEDRLDTGLRWYAPIAELIAPDPLAADDIFDFTFRRVGTTQAGQPALAARARLTLKLRPAAETQAAIDALPAATIARPVALDGLSATISVPFVDGATGSLRRTELVASVSVAGDLVAVDVELIGDAVRLAYGALSIEGFQAEALRVSLAYSFESYVPVTVKGKDTSGGKEVFTPLPVQPKPHLEQLDMMRDADLSIRGQRVRIEVDPDSGRNRGPMAAIAFKANPLIAAHLQKPGGSIAKQSLVIQPALNLSATVAGIITQTRLGERTQLRRQDIDALMPCNRFPSRYREERNGIAQPVGCLDALSLGQAQLRSYAEIETLAEPGHRVFRSLLQPNRFLVLPATYAIARFPADHAERAYRPAITLYAALDPSEDRNNRVVYRATLEPDLPVTSRRRLLAALKRESLAPVIDLPTAIPAEVECAWTLGGGLGVEATTLKTPEGFQVALTCDVAGALLLKELIERGDLSGQARFRLPDGQSLDAVLSLDLAAAVGPWSSGPVEVDADGADSTLRNRAEVPVDVRSVSTYRGGALVAEVALEARLQPDETRAISLPEADEAFADALPQPGLRPTIEEVRALIEQVRVNLLFVDLVDHAAHGLQSIGVEARLDSGAESVVVAMAGQPARGEADFMLPLTRYVGDPTLQFRAIKTPESGDSIATEWMDWRLATAGNVVSLTWDLVGDPAG